MSRIGRTVGESEPLWPAVPAAKPGSPNVVLIVLDDVGFAQPSPFGGACEMPTFDRLARTGVRVTNFHATPLCSPTRACLMTGRNHHAVGMGALAEMSMGYPGYHAMPGPENAFLPAMLRQEGYNTFAVGKWHLSPPTETSSAGPFRTWPLGRGFERFYGFLSGDTSQWFPDLVSDNTPVPPPGRPEDGYHLNADLADRAIQFIKDAHVASPDKPFFLYYALGAGHAPHHVEPEWTERYRGRFDMGWDAYREEVFARQVAMGVMPAHAKLSARDPDVPAWDSLSSEAKRMFARQMEVYAGFLSQTDHHIGRVLDFIQSIGELDNTIVLAMSDNGASAEGGPDGTFNEAMFFNLVPEVLSDNLRHFDGWGGVDTFPHYAWGWAWAGNTPFRRWKRETYRGGVSEPLIVSWPAKLQPAIRTEFAHAIDVLPTILDAAGVAVPGIVDGVPQKPVHGVSILSGTPRTTQYYEMIGYRAIYDDGWRAVCPFGGPSITESRERGRFFRITELTRELLDEMDTEWELYDVRTDPGETVNLAEREPGKLKEMIHLWYSEAERYDVLPIASAAGRAVSGRALRRDHYVFYPDAAPLSFTVGPRLAGRPHAIEAEVTINSERDEGVILAQGGRHVGFALYLQDGKLHHVHNYVGLEWFTVSARDAILPGRHVLRYEFQPTGRSVAPMQGKGVPARSKLYVDGALAGVLELPYSLVASFGFYGITCGYAMADSVDPSRWRAPFRCTAEIHRVLLDVSGQLTTDPDVDLVEIMGRQ